MGYDYPDRDLMNAELKFSEELSKYFFHVSIDGILQDEDGYIMPILKGIDYVRSTIKAELLKFNLMYGNECINQNNYLVITDGLKLLEDMRRVIYSMSKDVTTSFKFKVEREKGFKRALADTIQIIRASYAFTDGLIIDLLLDESNINKNEFISLWGELYEDFRDKENTLGTVWTMEEMADKYLKKL